MDSMSMDSCLTVQNVKIDDAMLQCDSKYAVNGSCVEHLQFHEAPAIQDFVSMEYEQYFITTEKYLYNTYNVFISQLISLSEAFDFFLFCSFWIISMFF